MTRHKHYAVSAAALLIMAALVMGCAAAVPEQYQPPAGKGAVRLSFNFARSITPATTIEDFLSFDLVFTGTNGTLDPSPDTITIPKADRDKPFALDEGTYSLEVIGYLGVGNTDLAAESETISVTVTEDQVTTIPITLKPIVTTGDGKFTWTINDTLTHITSGTITISPLSGGTAEQVIPLTTTASAPGELGVPHTLTLSSGYYQVEIAVKQNTVPITFQHILHIYQNQTSTFEYTLKDGLFIFTGGIGAPWTYEGTDKPPQLKVDDAVEPVKDNETVTRAYTSLSGTPLEIQLTNAGDYDTVTWYCNSVTFTTGIASGTLTIDGATAPFDRVRIYVLTVEGIKDSTRYTTLITIELEE